MATALVTGANRGIGLAITRHLAARGDEVIAVCREPSAALQALGVRIDSGVDVTRGAQVQDLARRLSGTGIDLLVCNAGILAHEDLGEIDEDGFDSIARQFQVNAAGPLRVVQALRPNLRKGSKVGLITSRMGSVADNSSGGHYGYRMSKAALNAAGRSLALDLEPDGIAVFLLHPGYVRTDMTGAQGDITPEVAAERLIARLDELGIARTGTFWHSDGSALPW